MAANITFIDHADDPRLAVYRDIRERDLVGREGRFVAEGKVVLNVLTAQRRFAMDSILLLENRLAGMGDTLGNVPVDVPVYVASAGVLDKVAGYHVHRGVLAIARRPAPVALDVFLHALPPTALVVVLVGISNHDNVGAIFRNAASFDADAVLLDETCCDPLYRKSIRVSVGAVLKVPFIQTGNAASLVAALRDAGFDCLALSPRGEYDISGIAGAGRTALLLGSEGDGLPSALLHGQKSVRVPMSESFDSLNVAAASAIALHRLWRKA